ncbi:hypothetical protein [Deinococcus apachensis]|uniref:hypothetical protein n=1 Tax=Deinococcus apachensis TaxID=309886 RepID=UPI000372FC9F|nr:hypothetical protein [Deinococcus apachensis]
MTLLLPPTSEVPVPKFNMADLTARLLAPGKPQEAQQQSSPALNPPDAPEAHEEVRERRRAYQRPAGHPSRQERAQARALAQQYRDYAEAWYQALRAWDMREVKIPYSFHYEPGESDLDFLTLGSNVRTPTRYLQTPAGEFTEGEVGVVITTMSRAPLVEQMQLGKMLDKLRHTPDTTPVSLLREDGRWHQNRERVARYAVAVLTLAVQLRDEGAEGPLRYAKAVLAGAH